MGKNGCQPVPRLASLFGCTAICVKPSYMPNAKLSKTPAHEFLCHSCRCQGFEVDEIVSFHWSTMCERQYELIKAVLDSGCGKEQGGDFWIASNPKSV